MLPRTPIQETLEDKRKGIDETMYPFTMGGYKIHYSFIVENRWLDKNMCYLILNKYMSLLTSDNFCPEIPFNLKKSLRSTWPIENISVIHHKL